MGTNNNLCECGCGKETEKIIHNHTKSNSIKGEYRKFIKGHQTKGKHISKEHRDKISIANSKRVVSEETKIKLSKILKGRNTWSKGRKVSEETRKKLSESHRGEKHAFYGKHLTEQHKRNISLKNKGKIRSEEFKRKQSFLHTGKKASEESRKRMSEAQKGHKATFVGRKHKPESIQKMKIASAKQVFSE